MLWAIDESISCRTSRDATLSPCCRGVPPSWGCGTLFGGRQAGLRLSDHAKGSASLAPFTEPGSCPIAASNCPRRGRSLYGTARATARGISELPGLAAHRVGAADDGQLGRPDRFAACRADGPWPEQWFREHYAHLFALPPDEARQEMMRFLPTPTSLNRSVSSRLGTTEPYC